jgi:tetratricopeptide (TPR) repeat protein
LNRRSPCSRRYEKAVELNPNFAQGWANLALLAVRRGDAQTTRTCAEKALALQPSHPTATLALAELELNSPADAEARLRSLLLGGLELSDEARASGLLGDALDAQDRPAEAFAAYVRGNELFRAEARSRFEAEGQNTVQTMLGWLQFWAQRLDSARWNAEPDAGRGGEAGHIFLMGFPRSGTTLAETVLQNHPDVVTLEERNTLYAAVFDFLSEPADLNKLEAATTGDLRRYRDDYWARVRQYGSDPTGKIFIDKNPFNALKLPLIYKLFPDAKVIFSIRDPRDVVLSCFRRRFALNASTYELLDLRRAAEFYAGTMRFVDTIAPKQPMARYDLVYERLVQDLPGVSREACAFIGADWRDSMMDIAARGRRGEVASASSAQIARGLFADGVGQWRRYREELRPILPILAPWVERFGYPAD